MDVAGAAVYLGRTPEAIYKAAQRRLIPFRRLGKKLVFDTVELDRYMQALEGVDVAEATARLMHNGTIQE
jgi:hypothetical protein